MDALRRVFDKHQHADHEQHIDLWHVYDDLSRTPFRSGIGIQCEDENDYLMNAWHVITPEAMKRHLDWTNRRPTQFISFYEDEQAARREARRRRNQAWVAGVGPRNPASVQIARVRLLRGTNVWAFSRGEMLSMMGAFGQAARLELLRVSTPGEWFVWGCVPEMAVINREALQ